MPFSPRRPSHGTDACPAGQAPETNGPGRDAKEEAASSEYEQVFVVAPHGRDSRVATRVMHTAGLGSMSCDSLAALPEAFPAHAGALLLTEEALSENDVTHLTERLRAQPHWSRLPVVLLTNAGRRGQTLQRMLRDACGSCAHVTMLERPLRASTLTTVVQTALQHRRRQYEVARLLARLEDRSDALEEEVEARIEALRERGAQVRTLAEALTRAEQRERQRLARVLHDHLQQLLYGAKVHAQRLRTRGLDAEEEAAALQELDAVADEAIELTRGLAIELNPPILQEEGFEAALEWLAAQMSERHGLDVTLRAPAAVPPTPTETRILLFRLVRELLFNVVKHAGTRQATVSLHAQHEDGITHLGVTVADDGCGFDPGDLRTPTASAEGDSLEGEAAMTGLGLFSVRERLSLFGGSMALETAPGEGTRVTLHVPVKSRDA